MSGPDPRPAALLGCGVLATDEGISLKGLGCVHDNDNALLTVLDFRALSLRRGEELWFHVPGAIGGAPVYVVGLAFPGVKDFMSREGIAGAVAVLSEAAFARDGYAEGVFVARALKRAMFEHMIDRTTGRVHMAGAANALRQAAPSLPMPRPGVDLVDVDMERPAQQVSMPRGWSSEISPDLLMLMMRNQRDVFGKLLETGYVLREEIADKTPWAIDADFYRKFYFREVYQKNKNLIESNSRLEDELGKEKIRFGKLRTLYQQAQSDLGTAKARLEKALEDLDRAVSAKTAAENARSEAENAQFALRDRVTELDSHLKQVRDLWQAASNATAQLQASLNHERGVVARLGEELDRASKAPSRQHLLAMHGENSKLREYIAQIKSRYERKLEDHSQYALQMEQRDKEWERYVRSLESRPSLRSLEGLAADPAPHHSRDSPFGSASDFPQTAVSMPPAAAYRNVPGPAPVRPQNDLEALPPEPPASQDETELGKQREMEAQLELIMKVVVVAALVLAMFFSVQIVFAELFKGSD